MEFSANFEAGRSGGRRGEALTVMSIAPFFPRKASLRRKRIAPVSAGGSVQGYGGVGAGEGRLRRPIYNAAAIGCPSCGTDIFLRKIGVCNGLGCVADVFGGVGSFVPAAFLLALRARKRCFLFRSSSLRFRCSSSVSSFTGSFFILNS